MRHLFTVAASISLLVCVCTCALWVRSYWISDNIEWMSHYQQRFVACNGGRVLFQINHGPSGTHEFEPVTHDAYKLGPGFDADLGRPWRFAGFWVENLSFAPSGSHSAWLPYTDIVVPLYAVAVASLLPPALWCLKMIQRKKYRAGFPVQSRPASCC